MISLSAIEIRRFCSRRLMRVVAALAALGILVGGTITFFRSYRDDDATMRARVEAVRAREIEPCVRGDFGVWQARERAPGGPGAPGSPERRQFCEKAVGTPYLPSRAFAIVALRDVFEGLAIPLALLGWLLGATFIGAEWHHRTITTLLTWEPRRVRVLAAKAAAVALTVFTGAVLVHAVLGAALVPAAALRGTTAGTGAAWFRGVAGIALRSSALTTMASLAGFAVATVGRNTAVALGAGFGYVAILDAGVLSSLFPGLRRWLALPNAIVFITGHPSPDVPGRSPGAAGFLLAAYTAGALAIAAAFFRRRDVA